MRANLSAHRPRAQDGHRPNHHPAIVGRATAPTARRAVGTRLRALRFATAIVPTRYAEEVNTAFEILAALSFCHLLNDMMQSLLPAMYPMLKTGLQLDFGQIGLVTLVYQLTASLFQPLIGLYTDKRPLPYALACGMGFTLAGLLFTDLLRRSYLSASINFCSRRLLSSVCLVMQNLGLGRSNWRQFNESLLNATMPRSASRNRLAASVGV